MSTNKELIMKKDINKDRQVKQIILMRSDLGMRRGKQISQACHASLGAVLKLMNSQRILLTDGEDSMIKATKKEIYIKDGSYLDKWLNGIFTKICLKVESLDELKELYKIAKDKGIPCSLIEDAGLTEFKGVKTITCAAIGPYWSDEIDEITSHLKLY